MDELARARERRQERLEAEVAAWRALAEPVVHLDENGDPIMACEGFTLAPTSESSE